MFDFLVRNSTIGGTQKHIDKLNPKIEIHVPEDIPLPSAGVLKKHAAVVSQVLSLEPDIQKLTDEELRAKTDGFRARYEDAVKQSKTSYNDLKQKLYAASSPDEKEAANIALEQAQKEFHAAKKKILDEILPEAFAVCRETGKRVNQMRHFDVQIYGGIILHNGDIAEMTTGEGKTLVATLPAYLNAITGDGVHVVTVNDYLAKRDSEWMGPIYEFLGLTVGVIQHDMGASERQQAYACDITYGTNNEFGFDYLRDNMVNFKEEMVQRPHHFAIVDEVDSILIDEARTPLIISGPAEQSTDKYYRANEIAKQLKGKRITEKDEIEAKHKEINLGEGVDYLADEKAKNISLTDDGEEKAANLFGIDNLHDMDTIEYRHHILQALKAKEFFQKDVDYVVKDGEVIIVDEFTGRMMPGRRWSDGLHQAVEAREGIKIERENQTLATITFQNYFRLYDKLSGMTGTAYTEATEFGQIYELDVVVIPTNRKLQRKNFADAIYKNVQEKYKAVADDIEECHQRGQPVLVGTISIEKSETLSRLLKERSITHKVLNAKFHESEAAIISQAGRLKGVTIATNMAGRGTDIVLGGNAEFLAESLEGADNEGNKEQFIEEFKQQCKIEHDKVIELGGLHVVGTERHESRRIDNQLRGRQGRQGDPGSSRFYVSLEDDLMRLFASDKIVGVMDKLGMEEGQALEHPWLSKALENAQKRVEGHNFEIRKHLLEFDDVMNKQREVIYSLRRSILESENCRHLIIEALDDAIFAAVAFHLFTEGEEMSFDIEGLDVYLKSKFGYDLADAKDKLHEMSKEDVTDLIMKGINENYQKKESSVGEERIRMLERFLMLNTIDSKWKEHLYAMDQLKEAVGLRSYGQRNPLIEYKREGFDMFEGMYHSIHREVAEIIFKIQPVDSDGPRPRGVFSSLPQQEVHKDISGMDDAQKQAAQQSASSLPPPGGQAPAGPPPPQTIRSSGPKVGRNDPCPCGSGKKYKKCCGQ